MRHSTIRNGRRLIWNTQSLWDQARGLERFELEVESVPELDRDCWFDNEKPAPFDGSPNTAAGFWNQPRSFR